MPMDRDFNRLGMRIGQALEIAVFKGLRSANICRGTAT
jgi:hypothetical protein